MKTTPLSRFASSSLVVLSLVAVGSNLARAQTNLPFAISFWYPTNGQTFTAPANVGVHAWVIDSNLVQTVQYFSGTNSIGTVTNTGGVMLTNTGAANPFFLSWSNVPAGTYTLTAVATDAAHLTATSAPVNITVVTPPPVRPSVYIYSPATGSTYLAPANLTLYARAYETTGTVQTVEFFAGYTSLGVVSNSSQVVVSNISTAPLFPLAWSNVMAGNYALKAVATDVMGLTATSSVVNISVLTNAGNLPLAVRLQYPTNGQAYTALARIEMHAQVVDSNVVRTVQFFANSTSLGTVTDTRGVLITNWTASNPYSLVWSNVVPGSYALTAVATDTAGIMATSPPVNVTVLWPPPPVVAMAYPTNGQTFYTPTNIVVRAGVADPYVPVLTMQYFANGTSIGMVTNKSNVMVTNLNSSNPFYLVWTNVPAGIYALTAVATDSLGLMSTSGPVSITVIRPPPMITIYYPTNGQTYYTPASVALTPRVTDLNAVVTTVQYFANGASIGIVTNLHSVMLTNLTSSTPFNLTWSNVVTGTYILTALATDAGGYAATSAPVTINVIVRPPPNIPLAIGLLYPTNGQTYAPPANIGIRAWVMDSNVVQTVQFFADTNSLGIVTNTGNVLFTNMTSASPFYLTWSNVLAGSYALTAVATDAIGNMATSAPVTITVKTPPPPNIPLAVGLWYPTNGQTFTAPANVYLHAWVVDSNLVQTVQYFTGTNSIGIVSNTAGVMLTNTSNGNPFFLSWSNVLAGSYALSAVATDALGLTATSSVVNITVTNFPPPPPVRPTVYIYSPTNNSRYVAPANLTLYARAYESTTGTVQTVEFFAGHSSLGVVQNSSQIVVSNVSSAPVFPLPWSNVPAGTYALTAVATDASGITATSSVVNITVVTNTPPPNVPFAIGFWYPTNGQSFAAPANVYVHAWVVDSNLVQTVQYFAGTNSIGIVSNTAGVLLTNTSTGNPFFLLWSNVLAGSYPLTAVAADSGGLRATSAVVNIYVVSPPPPTNRPPVVRITSPPNAAVFRAPVNIPIYAYAHDPDGRVTRVEFLAGTNSLGLANPIYQGSKPAPTSYYSNLFFLVWSNPPVGNYALTAVATDNSNAVSVSLPVNISVLPPTPPPTNHIPTVMISAIDPIAIEGTNCWVWSSVTNAVPTWTNWPGGTTVPTTNCGPKNATFAVYRSGDTNSALTVAYAVGGTASNGVDYVPLPGTVTVQAGQRLAMIPIVPLDDGPPDLNSTVILKLTPSTATPPAYTVGSAASAAALILDSTSPTAATSALPDRTFHLNAAGPNGAWFHVEYSTDMLKWTPICTNQVVNGSVDFIDPSASTAQGRFYRAVPEAGPPQ